MDNSRPELRGARQISADYSDRSREREVEDVTNLWIIHPGARALLPHAVTRGISANAVSVAGLTVGALSALCYTMWPDWRFASLGFLLSIGWLIADGLDGMVARATGTASALGRILDGLCDHGVFALLYAALAYSIGTAEAWLLAVAAAAVHAVQSSLYEAERARYHRRLRGESSPPPRLPSRNPLVRLYEASFMSLDRAAAPFDRGLAETSDPAGLIHRYRREARRPMKGLAFLSSNMRVVAIYAACLAGDARLFWWFEILPLSAVALAGILWHRGAERICVRPGGA